MTTSFSRAAAVGVAVLVLAACGERPTEGSGSPSGSASGSAPAGGDAFKACMVLDTGGVDDRSFNQSSWAGMEAAKAQNPAIDISYVPSADDTQYTPNLQAQVQQGCDTIIGVGGLMADSIKEVATANPEQSFAEIDSSSELENVYGIQYNTAEAAFLGGYLAAGMTKTGVVGTWGGLPIPPVTIFMDGFWEGVQHHNAQKGTNVKVLGWDEKNPNGGTFANSFIDQGAGRSITETLVGQGADIVMPVAGQAGLGAGAAAEAAGGKLNLIWVDTDGCQSAEQYCPFFISSVTKNLTGSVEEYVLAAADGEAPTGSYVGTLENDGVGLAPFNQFESKVPDALKQELETVRKGIVDGSIQITSPSAVKG